MNDTTDKRSLLSRISGRLTRNRGSAAPDPDPIKAFLRTFPRFEYGTNPAYSDLMETLRHCIPGEPYVQYSKHRLMTETIPRTGAARMLDLGCGGGKTRPQFLQLNPLLQWHGVEISQSYNINPAKPLPNGITLYDGQNIPFDDGYFDFVYSNQVFEHVRHAEPLLRDVRRVLRPGGVFFGSLSGAETYHWKSLFNYTPLGWHTVLSDNGFELELLAAGIDGFSLMLHHLCPQREPIRPAFRASALNRLLSQEDTGDLQTIRQRNLLKIIFAGHLIFKCAPTPVAPC